MKLLEQLDASFAGLICLSQSKLQFSNPKVQQINYLSNQLISKGSCIHQRQDNRELLCFTPLFGREFFFITKQFEAQFNGFHNLETIKQLTKKLSVDDIKIGVVSIDLSNEVTENILSYLEKSLPHIQVQLVD